ncbi:hypothetical protein [Salsuginibacillus kocurii]|uniref:hypothetical protein n=1 Tax=Salsuginibacillus kocurii TaxID=427078 RepID=UPI00037DA4BC|nr:hypothetical protein [Salsuginibacillus kocurii]
MRQNHTLHRKNERAKAQLFTYGATEGEATFLSLHPDHYSSPDFAKSWLNEHLRQRYFFGFGQSSQTDGGHGYHWTDAKQALTDVSTHFHSLKLLQPEIIERPIIMGGAESGGDIALRALIGHQLVPSSTFLVVQPSLMHLDLWDKWLNELSQPLQGTIVAYEHSQAAKRADSFVNMAAYYGIDLTLYLRQQPCTGWSEDFHALLNERAQQAVNSQH